MMKIKYKEAWILEDGTELHIDDVVEVTFVNRVTNRKNIVITKVYDLTEDEIRIEKNKTLFYVNVKDITKLKKHNDPIKKNKLEICMISVCPRCYEYSKFNAILVNEKEDTIDVEYICDCENMHIDKVEIKYAL